MMTVVCLYLLYSFKIILVDAHSVKTGVRTAFSQPLGMKNSDFLKKNMLELSVLEMSLENIMRVKR